MSLPEALNHLLIAAKILFILTATVALAVLTAKALPVLKWLALKLERDKDNGDHESTLLMRAADLPALTEKLLRAATDALWRWRQ